MLSLLLGLGCLLEDNKLLKILGTFLSLFSAAGIWLGVK